MFQTEIHLFLQQHLPGFIVEAMRWITLAGTKYFFVVLLCILIFGVDFKKGFLLLQVTLWTSLLTIFWKEFFLYPRPYMVDNAVANLDWGMIPVEAIFSGRDAASFWGLLPEDVVEHYRAIGRFSRGFPSGHTSISLSFWAVLLLLFPLPWVRLVSVLGIILVPFSRMVLGVHFLADLLGGYAIGGIILGLTYFFLLREDKLMAFLKRSTFSFRKNPAAWTAILLIPLIFWALEPGCSNMAANIIAAAVAFLLLARNGLPDFGGTWLNRTGFVLLAGLIYGVATWGLGQLAGMTGIKGLEWADFLRTFWVVFLFLWGTGKVREWINKKRTE